MSCSVFHAQVLHGLHDTLLRGEVQREDAQQTPGRNAKVLLPGCARLRLRYQTRQLPGQRRRRTCGIIAVDLRLTMKHYFIGTDRMICGPKSMLLSVVRPSVCSTGHHTPLLQVCCCGPDRQKISIDCCSSGERMRAVPRCQRT